jgi:hypothetical protein
MAAVDTSTLATKSTDPNQKGIQLGNGGGDPSQSTDAYSSDSTLQNLLKQKSDLQSQLNNLGSASGAQGALDVFKSGKFGTPDSEKSSSLNNQLGDVQTSINNQMTEDKNLQPLYQFQNKQNSEYNQYRQAFPSIVDNIMAPARVQARQSIAQGVNANNQNYNSRGLLYSGLRAGGNADVANGVAGQLASTKASTNQTVQDQANALQNTAAQTGIAIANARSGYANTDQSARDAILQSLMGQDQANTQAQMNLVGAGAGLLGAGVGAAIGASASPSSPETSSYDGGVGNQSQLGNNIGLGVPGLPQMSVAQPAGSNISQYLANLTAPKASGASSYGNQAFTGI